jgi:hypothetical protein
MCKLIDDPREGAPLIPNVLLLIEKKSEEISDPEARENAQKTLATIKKIAEAPPRGVVDVKECMFQVDLTSVSSWTQDSQEYVQKCADALAKANNFDMAVWKETMGEFASEKLLAFAKASAHFCTYSWESWVQLETEVKSTWNIHSFTSTTPLGGASAIFLMVAKVFCAFSRASGSEISSDFFSINSNTLGINGAPSLGSSINLHMLSTITQQRRTVESAGSFKPLINTGVKIAKAGASTFCTKIHPANFSTHSCTFF